MDEAFLEADASTRFKFLALAVTVLALMLLARLASPAAPPHGANTLQAFKQSLDRLLVVTLVAVPLFAGASIYLIRLGLKVGRSGQYPPPGMRVPVRTRIRRGA
jgi:fumarate reductase subunit D